VLLNNIQLYFYIRYARAADQNWCPNGFNFVRLTGFRGFL
jgi:hypothetical protein